MQFYSIVKKPSGDKDKERFRTDFHYDNSVAKGSAPRCPRCGSFIGLLEELPPYRVHLETWGEAFGDLAFWMNSFLVGRRFRDEYEVSGLKGLHSFERVQVLSHKPYGKARGEAPQYFRVIPKIGGARIDVAASGVEWGDNKRPTCELCLSGGGAIERWRRLIIDEASWNGDDIFYAFGMPGTIFVSSRFSEWAKLHQFRNLLLMRSADSSHDFYPREKAP